MGGTFQTLLIAKGKPSASHGSLSTHSANFYYELDHSHPNAKGTRDRP